MSIKTLKLLFTVFIGSADLPTYKCLYNESEFDNYIESVEEAIVEAKRYIGAQSTYSTWYNISNMIISLSNRNELKNNDC